MTVLPYSIIFPKVCGILIEPKKLDNTKILIENFNHMMPARMLFFFCGKSSYSYYEEFYKDHPFVKVINLNVDSLNINQYSDIIKNIDWNDSKFIKYTHVMIIKTGGCFCDKSKYKIEDFLNYDYIGGYINDETNSFKCFSGGFTLRNISAMIDVVSNFPPLKTLNYNDSKFFESYNEELYYVTGMFILNSMYNKKYKIGIDKFSSNFCTYTDYIHNTFCVYKYDNYSDNLQLNKFLEYCPLFKKFINTKISLKLIH